MNNPAYFLYGVLAFAALALIVNIRFKLPKRLFLVLAVTILVFTCWFAMETPKSPVALPQSSQGPVVSHVCARTTLNPGENRFLLSFIESCKGVRYSLDFATEQGNAPEETSPLEFSFELCSADGDILKCSAIYFSGKTLKVVFVFPENFDSRMIRFLKVVRNAESPLDLEKISEEKILN